MWFSQYEKLNHQSSGVQKVFKLQFLGSGHHLIFDMFNNIMYIEIMISKACLVIIKKYSIIFKNRLITEM